MSYQATYNTRVNTRIASDALKNIGKNFIQLAENLRSGCEKCTLAMDSLMNKKSDFMLDIKTLKSEYNLCYNSILKITPSISISEAKIRAIEEVPKLKMFAEATDTYRLLRTNPELTKGRSGKMKVDYLLDESFSLIEKTIVDVKTVLVTKAVSDCKWNIIDSASESIAQTIVAQNSAGNVIALNITCDQVAIDIRGFCDSSCVDHAQELLSKFDELGLKVISGTAFKHNKPGGGVLLSECRDAKSIIKKTKKSNRNKYKLAIPVSNSTNKAERKQLNRVDTIRQKEKTSD